MSSHLSCWQNKLTAYLPTSNPHCLITLLTEALKNNFYHIFLSDQCKEIEENKRIGKTRVLFKKIRDTKGIFHAKMGTIKDMDLTEAEYIRKRWQEYTEELYKNVLMTQITTMVWSLT